ncbi:Nif3-like dinuclear metal center hexameric protein [Marinomonas sp. MED121]|uniref:Nif3-like dinuclear metal center hexameric protein n=1 Tax=Marinomonas sp. MED121 TaxID=314277 RepID=UPI0002F90B78|nr:Nif3-like dinuclear metal center hexameric protein [Marinomonas sp. MED121]
MNRHAFEKKLTAILKPNKFKDYAPNGLQVQGCDEIAKVVTGVTACQALIDEAIRLNADAIFVHHGYFWKGESQVITGIKYQRISRLIKNDINLYAYHLPLDAHPELGNNAQLVKMFNLKNPRSLQSYLPLDESIGVIAEFEQALEIEQVKERIEKALGRDVLFEASGKKLIKTVALCSGGAQGYIEQAVEMDADLYLTGEVSEQTIHLAREHGIHFVAAGHHATERYGAKAMAKFIMEELGVEAEFVDIDNPA